MSQDNTIKDLTDEQVENWRTVLITLPLPPLYRPIGAYALLMPRSQVVEMARRVQELLNVELEKERLAQEAANFDSNIIRTRPRKSKHIRSLRG